MEIGHVVEYFMD